MTLTNINVSLKVDNLTKQKGLHMGKPALELTGKKFGRFTAIERVEKPKNTKQSAAYWLFECECGERRVRKGSEVARVGGSCGCLKSEVNRKAMKKMQLEKHGTVLDRFLSRFKKSHTGCWVWESHTDKDGYGILPANGPSIRAHRFSFEYYIEPIRKGNVVCHTCDNPSCVNPDHLFQGTVKDNCNDMIDKGRDKIIGSNNNKSKLTESDIPKIRGMDAHNSVIAAVFGVSESTIKRIKNKTLWRHVK